MGARIRVAPGYGHLGIVNLVWGSTFLAIRIAAREGSGFPPFALSAARVLAGSMILFLAIALGAGRSGPSEASSEVTRSALVRLLFSGTLLWAVSHGALLWAAQRAPAGLAAVLFGTTPIWSEVVESLRRKRAPTPRTALAILTGFAGILTLTLPAWLHDPGGAGSADVATTLALSAAPIAWAIGSTLQSEEVRSLPALTRAAYQQFFGGLACVLLSILAQEPIPRPTPSAWIALVYLVVPGLIPAFTSYVRALQLLPSRVVMSYAYVNPVLAVGLGAWLLGEPVTLWTLAGTALVLAGVATIVGRAAD